jgi:hypothetical protein
LIHAAANVIVLANAVGVGRDRVELSGVMYDRKLRLDFATPAAT